MDSPPAKTHWRKRRSFAFLLSAFVLAVPIAVFALLIRRLDNRDEHFYLDLTTRAGFECPEVYSFVSEFDPFIKWARSSSLPSLLSATASIDLELANSAYQQASAWRVISNWTSDGGASNLYASAEPHIAGGHSKQHRKNWLWRMRVDWGISVRTCLTIGNRQSNRSCLWTTPIIATEQGDLAHLFIGIPYRAATPAKVHPDLSNMQRSTAGFYLSNYASNARTDFTKYQALNTSTSYYLTKTKDVPNCGFLPSYYSPDAMSNLAFSSLQCGCSNSSSQIKVCIIVTKNMDTDSWGLFNYRSSCDLLKSYWAWNTGGSEYIVLTSYNSSSNLPVPMLATFQNSSLSGLVSSVTAADLRAMENTTACVEASMQQSLDQVMNKCGSEHLQLSKDDGAYKLGLMRRYIWAPTPPIDNTSSSCLRDMPSGQLDFKNKLCVTRLDNSISAELKKKIQSLLNLRDVKFKQNKQWKDGSDNRHGVYSSILAVFVSLVGTCLAATSHKLEQMEESLQDWMVVKDNKKPGCCWGWSKRLVNYIQKIPNISFWLKYFYRAGFVLGTAALLLYTSDSSMQSIKHDRDLLQSNTVPQVLSDGTVVLLTTTATYVTEPIWNLLYCICVITWVIVTITLSVTRRGLNNPSETKGSIVPVIES